MGSHPRLPTPVNISRVVAVIAVLAAVVAPIVATLWVSTPDVSDIQQLVKQLYLNGSDRGRDKVIDMVLALKVEQVLNKQEIMADYLSEIATGFGRYGVTEAACVYFKTSLGNLTLGQYALLAGVTQAPSVYDPTVNPTAAEQRRSDVLRDMVDEHYITAAQAAAAEQEPVLSTSSHGGC